MTIFITSFIPQASTLSRISSGPGSASSISRTLSMMEIQDAKIALDFVEFPQGVLRENPVGRRGIL